MYVVRPLAALVALAILVVPGLAGADPALLRLAYPAPPRGLVNLWVLTPWAEEVSAASGGTVEIKVFPGPALGTFNNIYDRLQNGVADIAYGTVGAVSSQFPKTEVASLPFAAEGAEQATTALWALYKRGLILDEFERVHLLSLFSYSNSTLHAKKPIKALADVHGLKIAVSSRVITEIVSKLGGAALAMTGAESYSAAQRGVIDAAVLPWPAIYPFKIQEVLPYHLDVPLGTGAAFVAMNKESYAKLPEKGKAALDARSYDVLTARLGKASERMEFEGRDNVRKMPGQTVAKLDPAEATRWNDLLKPIADDWVKATPNGAAIYAAYREELAKAANK
jgi:TRAP-type C4-dicarboxylate transport system substrate-binding protein